MNVVDNLNCIQVINKPCMRKARYVSLIPRTTLHSDSEHAMWCKFNYPMKRLDGTKTTVLLTVLQDWRREYRCPAGLKTGALLYCRTKQRVPQCCRTKQGVRLYCRTKQRVPLYFRTKSWEEIIYLSLDTDYWIGHNTYIYTLLWIWTDFFRIRILLCS